MSDSTIKIQLHTDRAFSFQELIAGMCSSALLAASILALLLPVFPSVPGHRAVYAAGSGLLAFILYPLFFLSSEGRFFVGKRRIPAGKSKIPAGKWTTVGKWLTPAVSTATLTAFLLNFRRARNGILLLANDFLRYRTGTSGRIFYYYETNGTAGAALIPCIYAILIALLAANLLSRRRFAIFPILCLLFLPGFVTGFFENSSAGLLLFTFSAAIGLFTCGKPGGKLRASSRDSFSNLLPPLLAVMTAILLCGIVQLVAPGRVISTENAIHRLERTFHRLRYETGAALLPEGDLREVEKLYSSRNAENVNAESNKTGSEQEKPESDTKTDNIESNSDAGSTPVLSITMEQPGKLYLRGFTGDIYRNSVWSGAGTASNIENAPRFYTLHENGFFGQNMIASSAAAALENEDLSELLSSLTIENISACKQFRYLPYGLASTELLDPRAIGDASVYVPANQAKTSKRQTQNNQASNNQTSDNQAQNTQAVNSRKEKPAFQNYDLSYISGGLPAWYEVELALASQSSTQEVLAYLQLEQAYYEYVEKTDLRLSSEDTRAMGRLFGTKPVRRTLSEILQLVHETINNDPMLNESARSDIYPDVQPDQSVSDPNSSKSSAEAETDFPARSILCASRAAVMLRFLGVPARYVEGFYLSSEEASRITPGVPYILDAAHAHAWAEFYLRGIGWIPFEATPGYEDNEEFSLLTQLTKNAVASDSGDAAFTQTELLYTSGVHDREPVPSPGYFPEIRFSPLFIVIFLLTVLLTFLVIIFLRINRRRQRLLSARREMREADTNRSIALQYAYAKMLMKKAGLEDTAVPSLKEMQQLNEKALFGKESLSEDDRAAAASFSEAVIEACKKKWSRKEYFRNHFLRWIL